MGTNRLPCIYVPSGAYQRINLRGRFRIIRMIYVENRIFPITETGFKRPSASTYSRRYTANARDALTHNTESRVLSIVHIKTGVPSPGNAKVYVSILTISARSILISRYLKSLNERILRFGSRKERKYRTRRNPSDDISK